MNVAVFVEVPEKEKFLFPQNAEVMSTGKTKERRVFKSDLDH